MLLSQSLKQYNTFGIDQKAEYLAPVDSVQKLQSTIEKANIQKIPIRVLGGGSNILLTKSVSGLVLLNQLKGIKKVEENESTTYVKVMGGEVWHDFVLHCIKCNWGGVENLSLIPGSVGASPIQNIGAYGVELKNVFYELEAIHLATGERKVFTHSECQFGYRDSIFKQNEKGKWVIISATFKLKNKNHDIITHYGKVEDELNILGISNPTIRDISAAVINIRKSKLPDPAKIGNSGSFFKNPIVEQKTALKLKQTHEEMPIYPVSKTHVKLAAGWLIDKAGWKGRRFENYGVHEKQALVLVNYGTAQGSEIYQLSCLIIDDIRKKFGITLEREVNIW